MQILTIRPKIGQKIEAQGHIADYCPSECDNCGGTVLPCHCECHNAKLAENSAEAERMTYAGRSPQALRSAKTFDETRVESMPLFQNAKRQGGLFQ